MTARFILSFDCEGKWGVADCLGQAEHRWLTDNRLREAYSKLVKLMDEYDVPATFAFVGLFGESPEAFGKLLPDVEELAFDAPDYLGPALQDIKHGSREGWHGAWAVDSVVGARTAHEIALHGVTHVPWTSTGPNFFARELRLLPRLSSQVASSKTFVFPRNRVAHLQLLAAAGLEGFREGRVASSRLINLLSELNLWTSPEADPPILPDRLVPIPRGFFVNWRHGIRSLIPAAVSRRRVGRLLDRAEKQDAMVHLWLHPENVASASGTFELLRSLVAMVARRRDQGRCLPMTQIDYVGSRLSDDRGAMTSASPATATVPS